MTAQRMAVNLDAMIVREDFALEEEGNTTYENATSIPVRELTNEGWTVRILRKPDFQRETNHWSPEQVVSLLECFINGDLIPSVILWKSSKYLFVIDGGHRLSVLRAWVEDDYGDGKISLGYFGDYIPDAQKAAAKKTRDLVALMVGSYQHYKDKVVGADFEKIQILSTRGLSVQWVRGNAEKAESSFFKINSQGTPLDNIEEALLKSRNKPIAITARAVIRAGKGNRYWSAFPPEKAAQIEEQSKVLNKILFDPDLSSPLKTLDLPVGGSRGIRQALQILIEYLGIACMSQNQKVMAVSDGEDDKTGEATIAVLKRAQKLSSRLTGNEKGSLGLHPAIYYYGPTGVHSSAMFLGTSKFISEKIANNNKSFFKQFSLVRERFEECLISNKELIATILQKVYSGRRVQLHATLLNHVLDALNNDEEVSEADIVNWAELDGKIVVGQEKVISSDFSDTSKSRIFINTALNHAIKCPICHGYLDVSKSVSYDHNLRKRDGGTGSADNGQLVHPFCNQSIKQ